MQLGRFYQKQKSERRTDSSIGSQWKYQKTTELPGNGLRSNCRVLLPVPESSALAEGCRCAAAVACIIGSLTSVDVGHKVDCVSRTALVVWQADEIRRGRWSVIQNRRDVDEVNFQIIFTNLLVEHSLWWAKNDLAITDL